jgi:hypothetical protein
VADRIGLATTTTAAAGLLAAVVLALAAFRPAALHALDDPPTPPVDVAAMPPLLGDTARAP